MGRTLADWDKGFPSHALGQLKLEAARLFCAHRLPADRAEWEPWRGRCAPGSGTPRDAPDHALELELADAWDGPDGRLSD